VQHGHEPDEAHRHSQHHHRGDLQPGRFVRVESQHAPLRRRSSHISLRHHPSSNRTYVTRVTPRQSSHLARHRRRRPSTHSSTRDRFGSIPIPRVTAPASASVPPASRASRRPSRRAAAPDIARAHVLDVTQCRATVSCAIARRAVASRCVASRSRSRSRWRCVRRTARAGCGSRSDRGRRSVCTRCVDGSARWVDGMMGRWDDRSMTTTTTTTTTTTNGG
jgi:hypothetical protein